MAAASDYTTVKKCSLENMHVNHVRSGYQSKKLFFIIKIDKFSKMKDKASSTNPMPYKDWTLTVSKNKNAVTLTLRAFGADICNVTCCVRYSKGSSSENISANKVSDGEYAMYISSEIIRVPGSLSVLEADCLFCELLVTFTRCVKINRPVLESAVPRSEETEEAVLIRDLKHRLNFVDFADFKIKVKDSLRYVHKPVFAARSKFFFSYFKAYPDSEEIELDSSVEAFDLVYHYVYYGEICLADVPTALALMKLAKKLQMVKLYEIVWNFVMDSIDAWNVQLVRQMGYNMSDDTLVSAADKVLARK